MWGIGRPAADVQAHDPRLDHDPAHSRVRSALGGHPLEPIGRRLAATDPGALSLPGPLSRVAPPLTAHLGKRQRSAIGLRRRSHDLSHKRLSSRPSADAAITDAAGSRAEIEEMVVSHARQIARAINSFKLEPRHIVLWR
jgi:hypothetical protein